MKQNENSYVRGMDGVTLFIARYMKYLVYVIMALLIFEVFSRRVFNAPTDWNFFVTKWVFGVYFLILAPYGMHANVNIRIDMFYANWSQRTKAIVDLVGYGLVWVPLDILVLIYGYTYSWNAYRVREITPSSGFQVPIYPLKMFFMVTFAMLLFQAISEIIKNWQIVNAKGEKV